MSPGGTMGVVVIRDARAAELAVLQDIDVATGQMFRDIGMPEVAEYDPWPLPDLEHSRGGRPPVAGRSSNCRSRWAAPAAGSAGRCWNTPCSARPPAGCPR